MRRVWLWIPDSYVLARVPSPNPDSLLYVKEDVIIPHGHTFHELIAHRARGKSGPLFHFDVHGEHSFL